MYSTTCSDSEHCRNEREIKRTRLYLGYLQWYMDPTKRTGQRIMSLDSENSKDVVRTADHLITRWSYRMIREQGLKNFQTVAH